MQDSLGDHLKAIEAQWTTERLNKHMHVYARMDGRAFHTFTRGLAKPFDTNFVNVMAETAKSVATEFCADIAYVQSDEISLGWEPVKNEESQFLFDGKIHKLLSVLPAVTTSFFCAYIYPRASDSISFDCRIMNLSPEDYRKMFYWRYRDASRNAISALAHHYIGKKECHRLSTDDREKRLRELIDLDNVDRRFMFGTFFKPELYQTESPYNGEPVYRRRYVASNPLLTKLSMIDDVFAPNQGPDDDPTDIDLHL